jgi:hypothetical protein
MPENISEKKLDYIFAIDLREFAGRKFLTAHNIVYRLYDALAFICILKQLIMDGLDRLLMDCFQCMMSLESESTAIRLESDVGRKAGRNPNRRQTTEIH